MTVDTRALEQDLFRLATEIKVPIGQVILQRSGFFARYLAEATQPSGLTKASREKGVAAVRRDIGRVYVGINRVVAELRKRAGARAAAGFVRLVKRGDVASAKSLLQALQIRGHNLDWQHWDGGAKHSSARSARGRVHRYHVPVVIDDSPKEIPAYRKLIEKRVGWAKSAWHKAISSITSQGFSGVPAWAKQNAPGTGTDKTGDGDFPHVKLDNRVSYIRRVITWETQQKVMASFEKSFAKRIAMELAKVIEKKNARTRAAAARLR
jgi:hypothetical protein